MLVSYVVWPHQAPEKQVSFDRIPTPELPKPPPTPPSNNNASDAAFSGVNVIQSNPLSGGITTKPVPANTLNLGPNMDPGLLMGAGPRIETPVPVPGPRSKSPVNLLAVKDRDSHWHPDNNPKFVIPLYLAKYADGDWDCNAYLHDGKLVSGCLP